MNKTISNNNITSINCYNHNNNYNRNYSSLKLHLRHIYMCVYSLFKPICTHTYISIFNIQACICLSCILTTVSCKSSYIYRATLKNGSVEYFDHKPDTATNKNIESFIKIKTDNIGDYE